MQHLVPRCLLLLLNSQQTTQSATLGALKNLHPNAMSFYKHHQSHMVSKPSPITRSTHERRSPLSTSKKKNGRAVSTLLCKKKPKKKNHQPFNSHVRETTPANRSLPPSYSYGCSILPTKKISVPIKVTMVYNFSCKFSFHEIHIFPGRG